MHIRLPMSAGAIMRKHLMVTLTIVIATAVACRSTQAPNTPGAAPSTNVYGRWVLGTPIDSTVFVGATQVELHLAPNTFSLTVAYPDRAPSLVSGHLEQGQGGALTFTTTSSTSDLVNLQAGQRLTRLATTSASALLLAPPGTSVPIPSSVWYRYETARMAGLTREPPPRP